VVWEANLLPPELTIRRTIATISWPIHQEKTPMHPTHTLTIQEHSDPADRQVIGRGIDEFNRQHAGDENHRPLSIFIRDDTGVVVAGLLGDTYYGWLAVNLLWVHAGWRGQGYGRTLLEAAEAEALRRGCSHVHLDTLSFQALDFYRKAGYTIFGELQGLPPGYTRYFLRKDLALGEDAK
jgi:GNAT superfamily N-acetyltransferase